MAKGFHLALAGMALACLRLQNVLFAPAAADTAVLPNVDSVLAAKPVAAGQTVTTTLGAERRLTVAAAREARQSPATTCDAQRQVCLDTWQSLLARGTQIEVPEPRVQSALARRSPTMC